VTAVVGLPSSAAPIRFDARSVAVIRPASRSGDERLCADRAADAEIKFLGRYKGGFIRDGVLVAIGAINAAAARAALVMRQRRGGGCVRSKILNGLRAGRPATHSARYECPTKGQSEIAFGIYLAIIQPKRALNC
jgi:hypothetical protein